MFTHVGVRKSRVVTNYVRISILTRSIVCLKLFHNPRCWNITCQTILNKQEGLISIKLTFTFYMHVHGTWNGVTQELEEMDGFMAYFDSTIHIHSNHYHFGLLILWWLIQQQLPRRLAQSTEENKIEAQHFKTLKDVFKRKQAATKVMLLMKSIQNKKKLQSWRQFGSWHLGSWYFGSWHPETNSLWHDQHNQPASTHSVLPRYSGHR